jgi:hypothetical protein
LIYFRSGLQISNQIPNVMGNDQSAGIEAVSAEFVPNHFQRTREFAKSELAAHLRAVRSNSVQRSPAAASNLGILPPGPSDADDAEEKTDKRIGIPYLAEELFLLVCSFVDDPKTLCNLACVCRSYRRIASDAILWRNMYREHWGAEHVEGLWGWKAVYRARHKVLRAWRVRVVVVY